MSGRDIARQFVSPEEDTPPDLSRTGFTSPFGVLSAGKTIRLPMDIEDELMRRSVRLGMSYGEYVRHVLVAHVVGADSDEHRE